MIREDKSWNIFISHYMIRCITVNDPSVTLEVKHTIGLHDFAMVAIDEDGVICVA